MSTAHEQFDDDFDPANLDLGNSPSEETPEPVDTPVEPEPQEPAPTEPPAPTEGYETTDTPTTTTEEPQSDDKGAIHIPKKRFDEVVTQRNDLALERDTLAKQVEMMQNYIKQVQAQQQQVQQPQQQPQQPPAQDQMRELRRLYNQSLIDGDLDRADQAMDMMDNLRRQQIEREVLQRAVTETRALSADEMDQQQYFTKLNSYVQEYPVFDENSPYYDAQLSAEALDIGKALIQSGMTRTQALDKLIGIFGPIAKTRVPQAAPTPTAAPAPTARQATPAPVQPPAIHRTGATGKASAKYDTANMTIEDFERLSESEIAKILDAS